jgi:hypothetical protein
MLTPSTRHWGISRRCTYIARRPSQGADLLPHVDAELTWARVPVPDGRPLGASVRYRGL